MMVFTVPPAVSVKTQNTVSKAKAAQATCMDQVWDQYIDMIIINDKISYG
jgi:hypothetical protein